MTDEAKKVHEAMLRARDYVMFDSLNEYEQMIVCLAREIKRLQLKLRDRKKHLRAANKGAECNAKIIQLQSARHALNWVRRGIYK